MRSLKEIEERIVELETLLDVDGEDYVAGGMQTELSILYWVLEGEEALIDQLDSKIAKAREKWREENL